MSHYPSYQKSSSSMKRYPSDTSTYLGKKRLDHDMDIPSKKRYDHEYDRSCYERERERERDRYDRYESKYRYPDQCKYNLINQDYPQYYQHSSSSGKYHSNRDNWYYPSSKYHSGYSSNKSPRREYSKKNYQKYPNETEAVRNLSHCEMPSPTKKEDTATKSGIFNFVSNIVSSQFPSSQGGTYQHISQKQQNINIKINVKSDSSQLSTSVVQQKRKSDSNKDITKSSKNMQSSNSDDINITAQTTTNTGKLSSRLHRRSRDNPDELMEYKEPPLQRPQPKTEFVPFKRNNVVIEQNPFDTLTPLLSVLDDNNGNNNYDMHSSLMSTLNDDNKMMNVSGAFVNDDTAYVRLDSSYLLAKVPNWRLVSNYVPPSQLTEERFDNIQIDEDAKGKFYIVYDEKYENEVSKITEMNFQMKNKLKFETLNLSSERNARETKKIQNKISENDFKLKYLIIKKEEIEKALSENTKDV